MKFKAVFSLESHTPLIHFESSNILGLRPTELKSKFDKFLINNDYVPSSKIITSDDGKKYLKYKVKLKNIIKDIQQINRNNRREETYPFYFGNMGNDYHNGDKKLVFFENIDVEFFCLDKELLGIIKDRFEEFISITNFGTRQNKGYGGFYLKKEFDERYIRGYKFCIKQKDYKKAMNQVELFYKFLRSGINLPRSNPFYTKPAIWKYFNEQGIVWEKKAIKSHCFENQLHTQQQTHSYPDILVDNGNEKIVRDLFGLSTLQKWSSYGLNVTKTNQRIKRFKSPLMFKFIKVKDGFDVYFFKENRKEEKLEDFCGETFTICAGNCNLNLEVAEFDLEIFLDWVYKRRRNLLSQLSSDTNTKEYSVINKILNSLKRVN